VCVCVFATLQIFILNKKINFLQCRRMHILQLLQIAMLSIPVCIQTVKCLHFLNILTCSCASAM